MLRNGGTKRGNGARSVFALVILFVTLLVAASGVSFAKNLSSSRGGDNAQVSVLIIDLRGSSSDNLTIDCERGITTASYNFTVTNTKEGKTAELAFKYDVIVAFPEALPNGVSVTVDGKERYGFGGRENGYDCGRWAFYGGKISNLRSYSGFFRS